MSSPDSSTLMEAAAWRARLAEADAESSPAFEAWLTQDPQNAAAWEQVQAPWNFVGEQAVAPEMLELRRAALAHAQEVARGRWNGAATNQSGPIDPTPAADCVQAQLNGSRWPSRAAGQNAQEIQALCAPADSVQASDAMAASPAEARAVQTRSPARATRRDWAAKAAAAVVLVIAIGAGWLWQRQLPDTYRTSAGERRVVTLADGSQIALDSQSEVKVRYSEHARDLILSRGQARIDVAHDVARPFSVSARGHRVIATGTAFNVDLFGPTLLVTLIEGHVIVVAEKANDTIDDPIKVTHVGEQIVLSPTAPPSVARVNLARTTSWENGEIIFENDLLSTVVARLNRYTQTPVVIGDPSTSQLRISGVFHTGDIEGFVATVVAYLPVRATKDADGTTLLTHL